jgi:hypothetical protein
MALSQYLPGRIGDHGIGRVTNHEALEVAREVRIDLRIDDIGDLRHFGSLLGQRPGLAIIYHANAHTVRDTGPGTARLRLAATATDHTDIDARRWHPALGLGVAVATLTVCSGAFFFGLAGCRAENTAHHPAACTPGDNHPGAFVFLAAFMSLAIFLFSLTSLPPKVLKAVGGLVTVVYVGWAVSVAVS